MNATTKGNVSGDGNDGREQLPKRELGEKRVASDILKYIPRESAEFYQFAPIGIKDGVLEVGIIDPNNIEARNAVSFIAANLGMPFKFFLISSADFHKVLDEYQNLSSEVTKALGELDAELSGDDELPENIKKGFSANDGTGAITIIEDAPVTKIVAVIIRHATDGNASDIHIEPEPDRVKVRFRVDGKLYTSLQLPRNVFDAIVARIKIITSLKIDEKRRPQDGRFSAPLDGRNVDFRVSTMPTNWGEKVVIRILDTKKGVREMETLGMTKRHLEMIRRAIHYPYGIILLTGPTGSGKSTTLYSMLNELDRESQNVVSLEDPIEYQVNGVSQSQVRPEIGYDFANGLRSILRQDPDIIMVGEIRDKETAQLAVQAALTGHLVFSTIHTNSAIGVIPRLIDMGIDPFLVVPTLRLAVGQRLVRRICEDAKDPFDISGVVRDKFIKEFSDLPVDVRNEIEVPSVVYRAKPSATSPDGTKGRIAVYEMLELDKELEKIILEKPSDRELTQLARAKGMMTMREDALLKAFKGIIPFEEVGTL